jgi:hypothetical protein
LQQRFGMTVVLPRVRAKQQGEHLEIDVLAYANGEVNRAFLVEVKSHPREEAITQLKITLSRFRDFFPEHRDKQLYGILAAVVRLFQERGIQVKEGAKQGCTLVSPLAAEF